MQQVVIHIYRTHRCELSHEFHVSLSQIAQQGGIQGNSDAFKDALGNKNGQYLCFCSRARLSSSSLRSSLDPHRSIDACST
jgi:hypothetical protein